MVAAQWMLTKHILLYYISKYSPFRHKLCMHVYFLGTTRHDRDPSTLEYKDFESNGMACSADSLVAMHWWPFAPLIVNSVRVGSHSSHRPVSVVSWCHRFFSGNSWRQPVTTPWLSKVLAVVSTMPPHHYTVPFHSLFQIRKLWNKSAVANSTDKVRCHGPQTSYSHRRVGTQ